jgi:DNA repair exonuclease SbcCD ATPase subunit
MSEQDEEAFTGKCPTCGQEYLKDRAEAAEARVKTLVEALEAHDVHVGMSEKARVSAIRDGRAAALQSKLEASESRVRQMNEERQEDMRLEGAESALELAQSRVDELSRELTAEIEAHRVTREKLREERERCARICDRRAEMMYDPMVGEPRMGRAAEECAERIRSGA